MIKSNHQGCDNGFTIGSNDLCVEFVSSRDSLSDDFVTTSASFTFFGLK